jgi:peroxiredoxin
VQLVELQHIAGELAGRGVIPFAVSYDSVETLADFAARNRIDYSLLADEGSAAIRRAGMLDEHLDEHHAEMGGTVRDDQRGVAYPGVFLLDEQGVVVERRFQRNYRVRESGLSLLEHGLGVRLPAAGPKAASEGKHVRAQARLDSPTYWRYQRLWATVQLDITPGCHVYASQSPADYVPLSVELSAEGAEVGLPLWPEAHRLEVEGLNEELWVYDGSIRVDVPFEFIIQRGEPLGDRELTLNVRWQACDATTCWPPEQVSLRLTVRERAGVE